jgi:hypothetical protein
MVQLNRPDPPVKRFQFLNDGTSSPSVVILTVSDIQSVTRGARVNIQILIIKSASVEQCTQVAQMAQFATATGTRVAEQAFLSGRAWHNSRCSRILMCSAVRLPVSQIQQASCLKPGLNFGEPLCADQFSACSPRCSRSLGAELMPERLMLPPQLRCVCGERLSLIHG